MEYRNELKFVVSDPEMEKIRHRLLPVMEQDMHQGESGYTIRSVYFDDIYDSCLSENEAGTDYRKKYRIRIYNGDSAFIRLEKKIKYHGMTQKITQRLSREEADLLLEADPEKLSEIILPETNHLIRNVYCEMIRKKLSPKCIVEYERFAFVESRGNVRITFDRNIAGSRQVEGFYDSEIDFFPVMPAGLHILEIKYDELLPHYILQAIDTGHLRRQSYSKYCAVRKITG